MHFLLSQNTPAGGIRTPPPPMSFIIAAPASGSGKTTVTLGLLRAISQVTPVRAAKSGPDYIDPQFHAAACGQPCINLDAWAMHPDQIKSRAAGDTPLIIEGAMGLFDGAPPDGKGATADLARILNLPVVLVVDAGKMAGSIAPLVHGFINHDASVNIAGVILNNVGSPRHEDMLRRALADVTIFGAIPRRGDLHHPSRHLGLVQAQERPDLETYLNGAASLVRDTVDVDALMGLHGGALSHCAVTPQPPPAQRIAVARDAAFAFCYPHILQDWRTAGAEVAVFSPLANESAPDADLIYLPGGYPELHAAQLAANDVFHASLRRSTAMIYGECGGYMVLGDTLTDASGTVHRMAGLLALDTSFAIRKRHLGYRSIVASAGPFAGHWTAHEFHYATTVRASGTPLFLAKDAAGATLPDMGLIDGRVSGSFAHIIDRV